MLYAATFGLAVGDGGVVWAALFAGEVSVILEERSRAPAPATSRPASLLAVVVCALARLGRSSPLPRTARQRQSAHSARDFSARPAGQRGGHRTPLPPPVPPAPFSGGRSAGTTGCCEMGRQCSAGPLRAPPASSPRSGVLITDCNTYLAIPSPSSVSPSRNATARTPYARCRTIMASRGRATLGGFDTALPGLVSALRLRASGDAGSRRRPEHRGCWVCLRATTGRRGMLPRCWRRSSILSARAASDGSPIYLGSPGIRPNCGP